MWSIRIGTGERAEHVDIVGDLVGADEQLHVPAIGLDALDRAREARRVGRHLELAHEVEPHAAHAGLVQAQQLGVAHAVVHDAGGAIVRARHPRQRLLEIGVVGDVVRRLHEHAAPEPDRAVHRAARPPNWLRGSCAPDWDCGRDTLPDRRRRAGGNRSSSAAAVPAGARAGRAAPAYFSDMVLSPDRSRIYPNSTRCRERSDAARRMRWVAQGLRMSDITRRDFLNGTALTIAAGLTPGRADCGAAGALSAGADRACAASTPARSRSRTRLRASTGASRSTACRPRSATTWSWSAAASAGSRRPGSIAAPWAREARILILDNHDDFGGHAKRNEFTVDGRLHHRLRRQPVDRRAQHALERRRQGAPARSRRRRDAVRDRVRAPALFVARARRAALFLPRESFGRDALVTGDALMRSARRAHATPLQRPAARRLSSPICRSPTRASASSSRSTTPRAIRSPASRSTRSCRSSRPRAIATISSRSAAAARRWRTASRAAPTASSGSAATRCRPPTCATWAIRASAVSACRRQARAAASPTSIISPTATRRSRGSWCARSFRASRPASTMDDVVLAPFDYGRLDADVRKRPHPARIRPASTCATRPTRCCIGYVRGGVAASRRGAPRRARLLSHDDPASDARAAGAAARRRWRRTSRRRSSTPTWWSATGVPGPRSRSSTSPPRCRSTAGGARLPGQPRRLSPSARPVRADLPASRPRGGRAQPGLDAREPVPHRPAQAHRNDLRGLRGPHPRRARPHARARAAFPATATSRRSPSTAGRTAMATSRTRCSTATTMTRCSSGRGRPVGRVAIANSDAGGDAYAHLAIEQAARAVRELCGAKRDRT